ncbi:MAG: LysE family translocator [Micrococcales bacterium]|nr:LysE family translocator [Micrococcales bacterium]
MLGSTALLGFCVALAPMVLTPGASFTLVSERGLSGDHRGALVTIVGTGAGILTHAVLAGLGLAAVVMSSARLYGAIRLLGAVYLIVLGLMLLRRGISPDRRGEPPTPSPVDCSSAGRAHPMWRTLVKAYVANVLNAKAATVYLTLAPQFMTAHEVGTLATVQLAAVHIVFMTVWLGLWAAGLKGIGRILDPRRWARRLELVGGAVLVAMGLRTAAE